MRGGIGRQVESLPVHQVPRSPPGTKENQLRSLAPFDPLAFGGLVGQLLEVAVRQDLEAAEVLRAIVKCRTAALGDHVEDCERRSSADRLYLVSQPALPEVPRAGLHAVDGGPRRETVAAAVLPSGVHAVGGTWAVRAGEPVRVYGLLMQAAAETLVEVAADPQHLAAEIGFLSVLHT